MLENCATINSCEALLLEQVHQISLIGQIPFTNNDFEMLCRFVSKEFSFLTNSDFEDKIPDYPATLSSYLVLRGIFNYSEGAYWRSTHDDIKEFNSAKGQMLGKAFLRFIEKNELFSIDIPGSLKYVTPILMHGIIPQNMVQEYFDKVIYPLVTRELICPTDTVELTDWLDENRKQQKDEERFRALSKDLETQLREFPDTECEDPKTVAAEIDALDYQITLLSDELQTLDTSNDLFETYQTIKRDVAEVKSLKTSLSLLEQKKQDVSDRIQALSQLHEQNLFTTVFPEKIPDPDSALMYGEDGLIDYLITIAETGSPEEKEKLIGFVRSLSEGITDNSIQLFDTTMEKYQTLLSITMAHLPEADEYEMSDISAAHVNATLAFITHESPQSELAFSHSDAPGIPEGAFRDIESLYDIEETFSDVWVETEITAEDTPSSENSSSSDVQIEIHNQAESGITVNISPESDIRNSSTGTEATDVSNNNVSPEDTVICTPNTSNNKLDFKQIANSLRIQILNEQTIKNEQNHSGLNLSDNSHPLTAETIKNASDELSVNGYGIMKDVQENTEGASYESVCNEPDVSTEPEIPSNTPEWNTSHFEQDSSPDIQAKTPHAPEEVPPHTDGKSVIPKIDDTADEFAIKPEFGVIPSESTETKERAAAPEINLFELAGIEEEISDEIHSDTRESTVPVNVPAKDPLRQTPQRKVMSLADDPKIPKKYKKKSFISRLIDYLFKR